MVQPPHTTTEPHKHKMTNKSKSGNTESKWYIEYLGTFVTKGVTWCLTAARGDVSGETSGHPCGTTPSSLRG